MAVAVAAVADPRAATVAAWEAVADSLGPVTLAEAAKAAGAWAERHFVKTIQRDDWDGLLLRECRLEPQRHQ